MRPIVGMMRGTSRDRYISVPSSRALSAGHEAGAEQERPVADRDEGLPVVTSAAASAPAVPARSWRRVTTASRLTTPIMMTAASNTREVTKPSARASCCRLTTGNSATAVPMQARALTTSSRQPEEHAGVGAGADDVVGVVQHGREEEKAAGIEATKVIR